MLMANFAKIVHEETKLQPRQFQECYAGRRNGWSSLDFFSIVWEQARANKMQKRLSAQPHPSAHSSQYKVTLFTLDTPFAAFVSSFLGVKRTRPLNQPRHAFYRATAIREREIFIPRARVATSFSIVGLICDEGWRRGWWLNGNRRAAKPQPSRLFILRKVMNQIYVCALRPRSARANRKLSQQTFQLSRIFMLDKVSLE